MNRLNITESAVFYCSISLFLKVLFFSRLFRGRNGCRCLCVELVKLLPVHFPLVLMNRLNITESAVF